MKTETYTSADGGYQLTLPEEWNDYGVEKDGTQIFANSKSWTGNLRITTLQWDSPSNNDKAAEIISDEVQDNAGASLMKIGEFDCAHYKTHTEENGEELIMYFWTFGKNNNLFMCSFSTDEKHDLNKNKMEVEGIIRSIRMN